MSDIQSLKGIGVQRTSLFTREVHVGEDGQWKKGQFSFLGKIVRAFSPEARAKHEEQLKKDLVAAMEAKGSGLTVDTDRLREGRPLTDRHLTRVQVPSTKEIQGHNLSLGSSVAPQLSMDSPIRLDSRLENQALERFLQDVSQHTEPLDLPGLQKAWDTAAETVARQQNEAFARQAPALSSLLHDPGIVTGPASFQLAFDRIDRIEDPGLRSIMHNALSNLAMTYELTSEAPCGMEEVDRHLEMLGAQKDVVTAQLERLREVDTGKLDLDGNLLHACLVKDLEAQLESIDSHKEYVAGLKDGDPLSSKAIDHASKLWFESAKRVLDDLVTEGRVGQDTVEMLQAMLDMRKETPSDEGRPQGLDTTDKSSIKQSLQPLVKVIPEHMAQLMERVLQPEGVEIGHEELLERLEVKHKEVLNQGQEWKPIEKELRFNFNGAPVKGESRITPGSQLGDLFPNRYEPNSGVNCATLDEDRHGVNLALTELTLPGKDGEQKTVFKGVRHAVNSAFGMPPGPERDEANLARAREGVIAALSLDPEILQKALKGETVDLSIGSVSLMTPDDIRGGKAFEKQFTREQLETWDKLSDPGKQPVEIEMRDPDSGELKTVKINLDVMGFSFGVNQGAVVGLGPVPSSLAGGWHNVNGSNERALTKLLGDLSPKGGDFGGKVGAFLESNAPQEQKDKVLALSQQVKDIWNDGSYKIMGHDPYKMVARLVVLCDMIGVAPMWNCKSGKDRTGMLDGEAKFLSARIELSGKVPEPGLPLTDEETAMYRQFMLRSGNLEMQQLNTGLGGFKTEGVKAIDERLGDPKAREIHRGASSAVSE
jgi:hypothetical protein